MDENLKSALKVYGQYLDEPSARMDVTIIGAIRAIRAYVYERVPDDREIQHTIVTAKREKLTSQDLEKLLQQLP
jgi:hypothetical protein